jgi:hypothetical protein
MKLTTVLLLFLSVLLLFPVVTKSQEPVTVYANIDFNKAAPEKITDYLRLETEIWKPIQQEHINQGGIIGWNVFRVWFAGTGSEYNYTVMEVYRNYRDMAFLYSDDIVTRVHPGINEAKLLEDTYAAREIVRAQSAVRIAALQPGAGVKPSQYVRVTYLSASDLSAFEKDVTGRYLPVFRERMKEGRNQGWDLYRLILPGGQSIPCQYISFEYLTSMDAAVTADWPANLTGIAPTAVYRSELWERLEYLVKD